MFIGLFVYNTLHFILFLTVHLPLLYLMASLGNSLRLFVLVGLTRLLLFVFPGNLETFP